MSVQPRRWPQPAPEIAAAVEAMYRGKRERPLPVMVRDRLGEWLCDEQFAGAYGVRGKPGWPPSRLALATIFQEAEDLTDRQAAEAARTRVDWKYALGLDLADPGFDDSILCEFRTRVAGGGLDQVVLDALLERLAAEGLVAPGGKQRSDSTHVVAAVRELNRLELAGESVRACLEALAVAAPPLVADLLDESWGKRYAARIDTWRMPASQAKKEELALAYGRDGLVLLKAVYAAAREAQWAFAARLHQVEVLRLVLVQNYCTATDAQGREVVTRRQAQVEGLPPGRSRITSPYDLDARWGVKRDTFWNGYKIHVTETCDRRGAEALAPDQAPPPNLITHTATTAATAPDVAMTAPIHQGLARRGLLPGEHYLDSGYTSAQLLLDSRHDHGVALIAPLFADHSPQAAAQQGFGQAAFRIDFDTRQATCPQGRTSSSWSPCRQGGTDKIAVKFAISTCRPCPVRAQCTTAQKSGRSLTVRPHPQQHALDEARAQHTTPQWQDKYALRAGIEGTISQGVAATGLRRARYRGLAKTRLEHNNAAAALNLIRLHAWWNGHPLDPTRTSHLARLQLSPAPAP